MGVWSLPFSLVLLQLVVLLCVCGQVASHVWQCYLLFIHSSVQQTCSSFGFFNFLLFEFTCSEGDLVLVLHLRNHHHNRDGYSRHPRKLPCTPCSHIRPAHLIPAAMVSAQSLGFAFSRMLHKRDRVACNFLTLASFTPHSPFEICPNCCMCR